MRLSIKIETPIEILTSYRDYEGSDSFADELADEISNLLENSKSALEEWLIFDEYGELDDVKCKCLELDLDSVEKDLSSVTLIAEVEIDSKNEINDLESIVSSNLERFCVDSLDSISYVYVFLEFEECDVTVKFKESKVTV